MPWYYAVAERDHVLQNPTSPEKIHRLGERLRLGPESRVLDAACGTAGPAILLASRFGCRIVGVERAPEFAAEARRRVEDAGLGELVEIVEGDAAAYPLEPGSFDAALCLGATFVWDGLEGTLAALAPGVRPGGHVAVGEPYWRRWPLPEGVEDQGYVPLRETAARVETAGLALVALFDASLDEWDTFESLHWRACAEWLADHPDDQDAPAIRAQCEQRREEYLGCQRELLGWAIFAARRP